MVSRSFAENLFADNLLKLHILRRQIPASVSHVTLYRCGNLVDLCRGPHLPHTAVPKGRSVNVTRLLANLFSFFISIVM